MPYTIKPGSFKYKKSNGQFSEIDCFEGPDLTEEVSALEKGKAPIIIDSATGNPIAIKDGADGLPVEGMKIHFSPVQSGTGDPSPSNIRPISGFDGINIFRTGVNIWDEELELGGINSSTGIPYTSTNALRAKNYIPVTPGAKYYFKSSSTSSTRCWYDKNKNYISTGYIVNTEITAPENAYFFRFDLPTSYGATYNHDISLNYPSTDTEYHSYTGQSYPVMFSVLGVNRFNGIWKQGNIAAGVEQPDTGAMRTGFIDVQPSTSYYGYTTRSAYVFVFEYDEDGNYLSKYNNIATTPLFTTSAATKKIRIADRNSGTESVNTGINYPSTETSYKPYINIYGGTLDAVNGVLTDVWYNVPLNSGIYKSNETQNNVVFYKSIGIIIHGYEVISNRFSPKTPSDTPGRVAISNNTLYFVIPKNELTTYDSNGFDTWLESHPTIFLVQRETPIKIQLDPITVTTLLGGNTIWSNANGTIELDYRADTKLFCQKNDSVDDVRVNGTSVLNNGVANIPAANSTTYGVVKVGSGLQIYDNKIMTNPANLQLIKTANAQNLPIVPYYQYASAFYGLAKAAGDTTQSVSDNAVGTYTPEAIVAIQKMLGVYQAPWELIREDNFVNDLTTASDHIITADSNGQPFELTDVLMLFELPQNENTAEKGYYGQIWFYYDTDSVIAPEPGSASRAANGYSQGAWYMINYSNKIVTTQATVFATNTNSMYWRARYIQYMNGAADSNMGIFTVNDFSINKINIKQVKGEAHYKLYGRRKWTT